MTMPGPKIPPDPPGPNRQPRRGDTREGKDEHNPKRDLQEVRAEALLDPPVSGAQHFRNGEGDAARRAVRR